MKKQETQLNGAPISEERLEELVGRYRRKILICASRCVRRYVSESDEEWSTALQAFYEAVKTYDADSGDFWPFASLVIRRRMTDLLRAGYRNEKVIPVDAAVFTADTDNVTEHRTGPETETADRIVRLAERKGSWPGKYTIRDEIEAVQGELEEFGFSFFDLAACSPKAEKSRKKCAAAAAAVLRDPALVEKMRKTKMLPMKELQEKSGVSGKVLEKHRRYLIASIVIMDGEYPLLADYLRPVREELEK